MKSPFAKQLNYICTLYKITFYKVILNKTPCKINVCKCFQNLTQ
uniref:Uncharacterized protein n=1 Tax=Anguilla anguilla TaxID=7936 RepID=A0A0E9VJE0_ANGAN